MDEEGTTTTPDAKVIGDFVVYLKKSLGRGKFGEVFEALQKSTNQIVAAKVSVNQNKLDQEGINKILEDKEMQVLRKLKHENLICMYDFRITRNNIYLFIEYCKDGDLHSYMKQKQNKFTDQEILRILKQICSGFQYLYQNKIMHRDLKPENIMMHNGQVKISDFGFARMIEGDPNEAYNFTLKGTPLYLPPQIFDGGRYSSKFDIWSLGVILHELMFDGKFYMQGVKTLDQLRLKLMQCKDREPQFPINNRNPKLIQLLSRMLQYSEEKRISWEEIFAHEFFNKSPEVFLGIGQDQSEFEEVKVQQQAQNEIPIVPQLVKYFSKKLFICDFFQKFLQIFDENEVLNHLSSYKIMLIKTWFLIQYQKQVTLLYKQSRNEIKITGLENLQTDFAKQKSSQYLRDYLENLDKQLNIQINYIQDLLLEQKSVYSAFVEGITKDSKYFEQSQKLKEIQQAIKNSQAIDFKDLLNLLDQKLQQPQFQLIRIGIKITSSIETKSDEFYREIERINSAKDINELNQIYKFIK